MDCEKTGKLICSLRKEKNMTQKELADSMNISDRTVSKWERGVGCPDVSLLRELSDILGVNIEKILSGDLNADNKWEGSMKRIKFYLCPHCGNVVCGTGNSVVSCCGRKSDALKPKPCDDGHMFSVEEIENDYFVTINHEMTKEHYVSFAAYATYDRVLLIKLYPEQNAEFRFPRMNNGKLYICCNKDGLFEKSIR